MTNPLEAIHLRADRSRSLHHAYVDEFKRVPAPMSIRRAIAWDAVVIAWEHHAGIALLTRFSHHASAHALMRPLIESTIRALWLVYVADYQSVQFLVNATRRPHLDDMTKAIRRRKPFPELTNLAIATENKLGIFHSFAHAGIEQLMRRRNGFTPDEVITALVVADMFAILAGEAAAVLLPSEGLRNLTLSHARPIAAEVMSLRQEGGTVSVDWTGALPHMPDWNDPEEASR